MMKNAVIVFAVLMLVGVVFLKGGAPTGNVVASGYADEQGRLEISESRDFYNGIYLVLAILIIIIWYFQRTMKKFREPTEGGEIK